MKHRPFHQFTYADRIRLETMYNNGMSVKEIALRLSYHISSIYNEIKRGAYQHKNTDWTYTTKYSADIAERKATYNATAKGRSPKIGNDHAFIKCVETLILCQGYSPAAALAHIRRNKLRFRTRVCLRTLYNYIEQGYFLHVSAKQLPYHGKRKRKKKEEHPYKRRSKGTGIEERPSSIQTREEFGHWELDSVIGRREKGQTLLVLTERKTRFEIICRAQDKTAASTVSCLDALERMCGKDFSRIFRSITVDNGCEFQRFDLMERSAFTPKMRTKVFYCHPYASSERGSNEKNNQMIRRKIPKGTRIEAVTDEEIAATMQWLNAYPRRLLNWQSSQEFFESELSKIGVKNFL